MIGCNMEGVAASSIKIILCDKISKLLSGHNKVTQQVSDRLVIAHVYFTVLLFCKVAVVSSRCREVCR